MIAAPSLSLITLLNPEKFSFPTKGLGSKTLSMFRNSFLALWLKKKKLEEQKKIKILPLNNRSLQRDLHRKSSLNMKFIITFGLPDNDMTPRNKAYSHDGIPSSEKGKWATFERDLSPDKAVLCRVLG